MENLTKKASEIKNTEIKSPDIKVQDIKPKTDLTFSEAKDFIFDKFSNLAEVAQDKIESTKLNIEKAKTGWSKEIINKIDNMNQLDIYKSAHLKESEVNGSKCLIKENVDPNYKDPDTGIKNIDNMKNGRAPIDKNTGEKIELHHPGQKKDSPLIELTSSEHRTGEYVKGVKNQNILHDNTKQSEVSHGNDWSVQKANYWIERATRLEGK